MKQILKEIRIALVAAIALAVIVSGIYPVIIWGLAQGLFPFEANGSLIKKDGTIIGSRLLAQNFTSARYFHPRPSSAGTGYDPVRSGGSNFGPLSRTLVDTVRQRVLKYRTGNNIPPGTAIPVDAVTASASGLDPHISLVNARAQATRVAKARGLSEEVLQQKISTHLEGRYMDILGEPRVNVLLLNLDLDRNK
jgi:potassium-transporting ATPase KdpC subunit